MKTIGRTQVLTWYKETYPEDKWSISQMNSNVTFWDVFYCLKQGFDFYTLLGEVDSLTRERVFEELANLMGVDYDYIYNRWLDSEDSLYYGESMKNARF